jgi:aminoglycoside phosphotransferase (APT) family kinase protein
VAHLLNYDRNFYRQWMHRAREFVRGENSEVPKQARQNLDKLAKRYDEVVERLVALPVTFIHGEFYPSNVLVARTKGTLRLCPVDWEMAAVGPGPMDLAALTAGNWTDEQKAAIAWAYYSTLTPAADRLPDSFLAALDLCRLHLAIQLLGWSPHWAPPPEYARNWLEEALRIANRLKW